MYGMMVDTIYIQCGSHNLVNHRTVLLKDVATLFCEDKAIIEKLSSCIILENLQDKDAKYVCSVFQVLECINNLYPNLKIINLGEADFIIEYKRPIKTSKLWEYSKVVFVAATVFFGSAFTIMTFNTDASVKELLDKVYELVTGSIKQDGSILEISYSIGLAIGIIVFFNHFSKFKIKDDPTPIQIAMRQYEDEVNQALIVNAQREEGSNDNI